MLKAILRREAGLVAAKYRTSTASKHQRQGDIPLNIFLEEAGRSGGGLARQMSGHKALIVVKGELLTKGIIRKQ